MVHTVTGTSWQYACTHVPHTLLNAALFRVFSWFILAWRHEHKSREAKYETYKRSWSSLQNRRLRVDIPKKVVKSLYYEDCSMREGTVMGSVTHEVRGLCGLPLHCPSVFSSVVTFVARIFINITHLAILDYSPTGRSIFPLRRDPLPAGSTNVIALDGVYRHWSSQQVCLNSRGNE